MSAPSLHRESTDSLIYQVSSSLASVSVSYMPVYVPIVMYDLRLFIVVLHELHCLQGYLHVDIIVIGIYHSTKFRSSTPSGF